MTDEITTLKDAIDARGPLAVWDLMTEDEKKLAAAALRFLRNNPAEERCQTRGTLFPVRAFRTRSLFF